MIQAFAGLWLGGLIALDLVETPAKFQLKCIERSAAVELGREVFHRFGMLEAAFSLAILVFAVIGHLDGTLQVLAWLLCALALLIAPTLRRRLDQRLPAAGTAPEKNRDSGSFQRLHRLYVAADAAKMVLLLAMIFRAAE